MCTFEPKPNSYWAYALVLLLWGHVAPFSLPITALVVPFFIDQILARGIPPTCLTFLVFGLLCLEEQDT